MMNTPPRLHLERLSSHGPLDIGIVASQLRHYCKMLALDELGSLRMMRLVGNSFFLIVDPPFFLLLLFISPSFSPVNSLKKLLFLLALRLPLLHLKAEGVGWLMLTIKRLERARG